MKKPPFGGFLLGSSQPDWIWLLVWPGLQAPSFLTRMFSRLLWRAALFLLTIPLLIILSMTGTASL